MFMPDGLYTNCKSPELGKSCNFGLGRWQLPTSPAFGQQQVGADAR